VGVENFDVYGNVFMFGNANIIFKVFFSDFKIYLPCVIISYVMNKG
jgi:hypothetical protein